MVPPLVAAQVSSLAGLSEVRYVCETACTSSKRMDLSESMDLYMDITSKWIYQNGSFQIFFVVSSPTSYYHPLPCLALPFQTSAGQGQSPVFMGKSLLAIGHGNYGTVFMTRGFGNLMPVSRISRSPALENVGIRIPQRNLNWVLEHSCTWLPQRGSGGHLSCSFQGTLKKVPQSLARPHFS